MKNINAERKEDNRKSDVINSFLDAFLYTEENGFTNVSRKTDKASQMSGIDIEFDYNGKHYICDEKAAVTAVNQDIPLSTFCLELSMIDQGGKLRYGWFMNNENVNDSYMFIWPDKADTKRITKASEIRQIEVCLVKKEKLKEYFLNLGWTEDRIRRKQDMIRENNGRCYLGKHNKDGFKFSYSEESRYTHKPLPEKPINLILKREIYRKISDFNKIIIKEKNMHK